MSHNEKITITVNVKNQISVNKEKQRKNNQGKICPCTGCNNVCDPGHTICIECNDL